ncbi:hypothetical protein N7U68_19250 [Roseovarius pelagicus]|uniref:Protein ImuA n=2 Tax=Roseovarius pelagicus TaxID=2980108 RepID=A0ABY6DGE5_9RHOB|nr:hypothetical protein N7U68_19250 [Roseovarius pelagicus]
MHDKHNIYPLKPDRVHEVYGPSAMSFAAMYAAKTQGTVFWVKEHWRVEQLNPLGVIDVLHPENLIIASTKEQVETLAVAEEALRSGAISVVIMELRTPLNLTAGRRLQLAAQAGKAMGIALISEGMGSNAAETRWHCYPVFDPQDSTLQRWELIRNKSGTLGVWNVRWSSSSRRINMVSETGK